MGGAADAIREADGHWATVSLLSSLIDQSARKRRRAAGHRRRRAGEDGPEPDPPQPGGHVQPGP